MYRVCRVSGSGSGDAEERQRSGFNRGSRVLVGADGGLKEPVGVCIFWDSRPFE